MVKMRLARRRSRGQRVAASDLWRRLRTAVGVLVAVLAAGTIGYMFIGLNFLDALYQTVVTVSTVGYREVGEVDNQYQIFTITLILFGAGSVLYRISVIVKITLILFGAGSVLYTIGVLIETLVEGRLTSEFGRRRMERTIETLHNHIVVCGWGQVGQAISTTLWDEGADVVVIDRREELADFHYLNICGDATDDGILSSAGVERARALVVALDSAADNVYVTLSARALNPDIFIVARATSPGAEPKLFRAGADRVVNPHQLGGAHMAALVTQPNVAEFLDIAMRDREIALTITEVTVPSGCSLLDKPLREAELGGVTILAMRERSGRFVHHPDLSMSPGAGDVLIALGTTDEHAELRRLASS